MQNSQEYKPSISWRSLVSNLLILASGIGLIAWSWYLIQARFTSVISRDAVINGVLTDLKTPAEGIVSQQAIATLRPGIKDAQAELTQAKFVSTWTSISSTFLSVQESFVSLEFPNITIEQNRQLVTMLYGNMTWWKRSKKPGSLDVFLAMFVAFLKLTPLMSKYERSKVAG